MPRNVRNFWVETRVDGRGNQGPSKADGGFSTTVYIRNAGDVQCALVLRGRALNDGTLILDVIPQTEVRINGESERAGEDTASRGFAIVRQR